MACRTTVRIVPVWNHYVKIKDCVKLRFKRKSSCDSAPNSEKPAGCRRWVLTPKGGKHVASQPARDYGFRSFPCLESGGGCSDGWLVPLNAERSSQCRFRPCTRS